MCVPESVNFQEAVLKKLLGPCSWKINHFQAVNTNNLLASWQQIWDLKCFKVTLKWLKPLTKVNIYRHVFQLTEGVDSRIGKKSTWTCSPGKSVQVITPLCHPGFPAVPRTTSNNHKCCPSRKISSGKIFFNAAVSGSARLKLPKKPCRELHCLQPGAYQRSLCLLRKQLGLPALQP